MYRKRESGTRHGGIAIIKLALNRKRVSRPDSADALQFSSFFHALLYSAFYPSLLRYQLHSVLSSIGPTVRRDDTIEQGPVSLTFTLSTVTIASARRERHFLLPYPSSHYLFFFFLLVFYAAQLLLLQDREKLRCAAPESKVRRSSSST